MKAAGCWRIFYGVESGTQELLDTIEKGENLEQIEEAFRLTKKVGIQVEGSFMLGLPGETPETIKRTINFAKKLGPEFAAFCMTIPFPGTKLYEIAQTSGTFRKDLDWSRYNLSNQKELVFVPAGMTENQIKKAYKQAYRSFYFSLPTLLRYLKHLRSWNDVKRYWNGFIAILNL
jgi:radical SAM superfamily enzyme YgiQ (UPF0313 family)